MEQERVILKKLREHNNLSLDAAAKLICRRKGWLSEIENNKGRSILRPQEYQRIFDLYQGNKHKRYFGNWIKNASSAPEQRFSTDGAIYKFLRTNKAKVIKQGNVSVDFGPRRVQLTPRTYFMEVKGKTYQKLCQGLLSKVIRSGGIKSNVYRLISDSDLADINGPKKSLLDRQTILSLTYLPYKKRQAACRKLSDALAMSIYSDDMGKTLDFISSKMATNPHLPSKRKQESDRKRRVFKDQVELTLVLEEQNSEPINKVLYQINSEGQKYMGVASKRAMYSETESHRASRIDSIFFDCADSTLCKIY